MIEELIIHWIAISLGCSVVTMILSKEDGSIIHYLSWLVAPVLLFVTILLSVFELNPKRYFKSLFKLLFPE